MPRASWRRRHYVVGIEKWAASGNGLHKHWGEKTPWSLWEWWVDQLVRPWAGLMDIRPKWILWSVCEELWVHWKPAYLWVKRPGEAAPRVKLCWLYDGMGRDLLTVLTISSHSLLPSWVLFWSFSREPGLVFRARMCRMTHLFPSWVLEVGGGGGEDGQLPPLPQDAVGGAGYSPPPGPWCRCKRHSN